MEYYVVSKKVGVFANSHQFKKYCNAEVVFNKSDKLLYLVAKHDLG